MSDRVKFLYEIIGDKLLEVLNRSDVTDIMYNQDGNLWIDSISGRECLGTDIITQMQAKQIIELVASYDEKNINRETQSIGAILPNGERFQGMLYDITGNNPTFSIRKKSTRIFTLDELEEKGSINRKQKEYIKNAVLKKKNILIVGGTGTGKTTFANACMQELSNSEDRIAVIEDERELQLTSKNNVRLVTYENIEMINLLRMIMRMNVDRIIVGELRTGEATLELLKAWNSGHEGGISTIHANSAYSGLLKLEQYLSEVTQKALNDVIVESVHVIVNIVKVNGVRKINEIAELKGYDSVKEKYILEKVE